MNDVMLDLETMGTGPRAVILSLGACFFDKEEVGDQIYLVLDREEQIAKGREVDASTMSWWAEQSVEARKVFDEPQTPVEHALNAFSQFVELFATDPKDVRVWGNGSDFDNIILGTLYDLWGIKKPWSYRNNRCYRTLKNIAIPYDSHDLPQCEGTYHNALDDAIYQAAMAGRYLKGSLK